MPAVVYNSYTLPLVTGKFSHGEDFRSVRVSCEFLIAESSASALVAACASAEQKLSEVNKDLTVSHGGSAEYSYSHSSNTGFLARPRVEKIADERATELTRAYRFSCECQLPMTQYGAARSRTYTVSHAPTRQRTVSFAVEYTASGGSSCSQTYADGTNGGKAWAATILSALGGTWELISENTRLEQEGKILSGSIAYKEILFAQSASGTDLASIVDCQANYSVDFEQRIGLAQTANFAATPRVQVSISYSARVSRDSVAAATSMDAVYHSTVRPYLLNQARAMLGLANYSQAGQGYIILSERKSYDPYAYTVSGSLTFLAGQSFSVLDFSERISVQEDSGIVDVALWDGFDDTYSSWGIGGRTHATRTVSVGQLGREPSAPAPMSGGFGYSGTWRLRERVSTSEKFDWGAGTPLVPGASGVSSSVYWAKTWSERYVLISPVSAALATPVSREY